MVMVSTAPFGGGVDGAVCRGHGGDDGADVDDRAAFGADELDGCLGGEEKTEDVEVELAVEVLGGDLVDGAELVDAGVVDEDVEVAVLLFDRGEGAGDVFGFGEVALDGGCLAPGGGDVGYDLVGSGFAGGVVDDDRGPGGGEVAGDGGSDALGGSGDEGDLVGEGCCSWWCSLVQCVDISTAIE